MITVKIDNLVSHWTTTPDVDKLIWDFCSAKDKSSWFSPSYKIGAWDGVHRFYNLRTRTLPSGLVPETVDFLRGQDLEVEVAYSENAPVESREDMWLNFEIDPTHQLEALAAMAESRFGVISAATNSGKTKIAEAWCCLNKLKTIYFVPTRELLNQTLESFNRDTNLEVGYISSDLGWKTDAEVVICLITSVVQRKSRYERNILNRATVEKFKEVAREFEAVIVDECHHLTAETWRWALKQCSNARRRYGLSGTPWRAEDSLEALQVKSLLGPCICRVTNDELIAKSWSAKPKIRIVELPGQDELQRFQNLEYGPAYEEFIVNNVLRNNIIAKICQDISNNQGLVLVVSNRVEHCRIIYEILKTQGIKARMIIGKSRNTARRVDLEDFKEGRYNVLISTVMGEGVDIRSLNAVILASGGKSFKLLLQRVGRGIRRKTSGQNVVDIWDFKDSGNKYLSRHFNERLKIYQDEGFEIDYENQRF